MLQNKKLIQMVISAVMALLLVNVYLKNKEQTIESGYNAVDVLAAAQDIPPHTLLSTARLTTKKIPLKFVEPGAIMIKIPGQEAARLRGKVSAVAIPSGTQITNSNMKESNINDPGVAPRIPPGKRAFLLRLGNLDVGKLMLPGDHVDVLATFTIREKDATSRATYTILQNVLVLSVGPNIRQRGDDVSAKKEGEEGLVITLALDPIETERLALAQTESQGEITVVVRPHGEDDIRPVPGVTPSNLLANPMPPPPPPAIPGR